MGSLTSEESKRINDIAIGVATGVTASVAAGIAIDVLCGILTTNYENNATKQQADANTTDAIASDLGASAMKTKAGAMDIATKAMKLN